MPNLLVTLTVVKLLTNSVTTTVCSDGKGGVLREERYVVSTATQTVQMPPLPLPLRTKPMRQASMVPSSPLKAFTASSSLTDPGMLLSAASVIEPDCECPFFRVSFTAHTNRIYSFQRSRDLMTWELRPPEVDGEEGVMGFFDVFEGGAMYRIASREGVLPP